MKEHFFGLTQKEHLSAVSVTLKDTDVCPIRIRNARIIRRNAIEHEIQFHNNGQRYIIYFKANRKYLSVYSTYPFKGIRSCIEHDGSLVKKIKMGYFKVQEVLLTEKGEMMLSFLLNDLINTTQLAKKNPNIIYGYFRIIREKLKEQYPFLHEKRINRSHLNKNPYTTLLSDSVRKKHFFAFNGVNMFLSFQAIIENHPELFSMLMN